MTEHEREVVQRLVDAAEARLDVWTRETYAAMQEALGSAKALLSEPATRTWKRYAVLNPHGDIYLLLKSRVSIKKWQAQKLWPFISITITEERQTP